MQTILIVEQDRSTPSELSGAFLRAGFKTATASSCTNALSRLRDNERIDIALLDLDQEDCLHTARKIAESKALPIVYRVGNVDTESLQTARNLSCYGIAPKQGGTSLLIELVRLALDLYDSHRQAKRAYEAHNDLLQSLSETVVAYDRDGNILFLNRQAALILGDEPERFLGKNVFDLFPREHAERGIERIRSVFSTGETTSSETSLPINGKNRWFELRYQPVKGESGEVERVLQIGFEVTDRTVSDLARRESEERYRLLAEHSTDVVAVLDSTLNVTYVSPSVQEIYGHTPADLRQHGLPVAVHPEDLRPLQQHITSRIESRESVGVSEFRVTCSDGTVKWAESRGRYMYDESGTLSRIVVNVRDITDRKKAEQEVKKNEERYRLFAENSSDAILVLNREFGYDYISPSIEELLGYTPEEIDEQESMYAVHPEDVEELKASVADDIGSGVENGVYVHRERTKSGEIKWVESRARYLYDDNQIMRRGIVVIRDITERKEAEDALAEERDRVKQLLRYQELLSNEIHHRVKNDMNFVTSLLSLQASQAKNPQTEFSLLEAARRITVVSKVYERLYRTGNFTVMSVKELLGELADSLKESTVPQHGVLEVAAEEFVVPTREAVSLGIILNELITNSAKYAFDDTRAPVIKAAVTLKAENRTELTISDNGSGFPEHILRGEELGYGLTIVEALVEQHGGELELKNNSGAVARVVIPFQL